VCLEQLLVQQIRAAEPPELLVKFAHPALMTIALLAMAYGGYLGYQIRTSPADSDSSDQARAQHPLVMAGVVFLLLAGTQGGIGSLLLQEVSPDPTCRGQIGCADPLLLRFVHYVPQKPLVESLHAKTALAGLALFGLQGLLSNLIGVQLFRSLHAYVGYATLAVFLIHFLDGIQLAFTL
jgi:hypothetical protein